MATPTWKICDVCAYKTKTSKTTCPSCGNPFPEPGQISAHTGEVVEGRERVKKILENTDKFRFDQEETAFRLSNKITNEDIVFTGLDMDRLMKALQTDKERHPNASLNQRFGRLWKKFEALAS